MKGNQTIYYSYMNQKAKGLKNTKNESYKLIAVHKKNRFMQILKMIKSDYRFKFD